MPSQHTTPLPAPSLSSPSPFLASAHTSPDPHLLLATTGSVATIKLPQILTAFAPYRIRIRLLLTRTSLHFLTGPPSFLLHQHPNLDGIHLDDDEWPKQPLCSSSLSPSSTDPDPNSNHHDYPQWTRGQPILHIELRRWADGMLIAPLSANTMAKMVHGLADNLVTSVLRAWDTTGRVDVVVREGEGGKEERTRTRIRTGARTGSGAGSGGKKKVWVAPAMNTAMWEHPVTAKQVKVLEEEWGEERAGGWVKVLWPVEKELACGDVGGGAMMEWWDIVDEVVRSWGLERKETEEGEYQRETEGTGQVST